MDAGKKIKDIMIGIFEYPHIPYWFSIKQAVKIIKVSFLKGTKYSDPVAVLVFDEKYNLLGTLTLLDILRGIEPRLAKGAVGQTPMMVDQAEIPDAWTKCFTAESREHGERQVSEIMMPSGLFVEPEDEIAKAAYLMVENGLVLVPVLENKRKLTGIVRMRELFDEITDVVLKE